MREHLGSKAVAGFDVSAMRICEGFYEPTMTVVIYPLAVRRCFQTLMEVALKEIEQGSIVRIKCIEVHH